MKEELIFSLVALPIVLIVVWLINKRKTIDDDYVPKASCPNCKTILATDSYEVIKYDDPNQLGCHITNGELWICKKCCNHPETLKDDLIIQNLREKSWEESEIKFAILAVKKYKKQMS